MPVRVRHLDANRAPGAAHVTFSGRRAQRSDDATRGAQSGGGAHMERSVRQGCESETNAPARPTRAEQRVVVDPRSSVLALQRAAGNRAVTEALRGDATVQPCGGGACSGCAGKSSGDIEESAGGTSVQRTAGASPRTPAGWSCRATPGRPAFPVGRDGAPAGQRGASGPRGGTTVARMRALRQQPAAPTPHATVQRDFFDDAMARRRASRARPTRRCQTPRRAWVTR